MTPLTQKFDEDPIRQSLKNLITQLIPIVPSSRGVELGIMQRCCPAPVFGKLTAATVATVALNPSRLEFESADGSLLDGPGRRLPTLDSLGIHGWEECGEAQASRIVDELISYFDRAPYRRWFDPLDRILRGCGLSYYSGLFPACHLDLVPFATAAKWGEMSRLQQSGLLELSSKFFLEALQVSHVRVVLLNGMSVVRAFEEKAGIKLTATEMSDWTLNRTGTQAIKGVAFRGRLLLPGAACRSVAVLGFNHNLQSSYGVSELVRVGITNWVIDCFAEVCN